MANMNIRTPRFYTDIINYVMSRGSVQDGNFDVLDTNALNEIVGIKSGGGTEAELFDMRPLNKVTFDTAASATTQGDHVIINLNTSTFKKSFVAILNHNMKSADAKVLIKTSGTLGHVQAVDMASATAMSNPAEVVNADTISSSIVTPATDGSTIVRFDETSDRYVGLQFEGTDSGKFDGSNFLSVGCILVGEYYDMPHAPDLDVKRSIIFDKNKVQESLGGQRYSNMTSYGRTGTTTSLSPFNNAIYGNKVYGGRLAYDMNFSYLNATDVMPTEYDTIDSNLTYDAVVEDIWNKTNGSHLPFIFSIDKDSEGNDAESEHIFARFAQNSLNMEQVAPDVFNVSMRIEEEF